MIKQRKINVLIACEESQVECKAFLDLGANAYSCDLQACRPGANISRHIVQDVTPLLQGQHRFYTQDGVCHRVNQWDLIIAHPPCTYLCKVSSIHMTYHGQLNGERFVSMLKAREFFFACLNAKAKYVAVENPLPMAWALLPKPTTYVQPYWFGSNISKKTLYWLKNLPPPLPTIEHPRPSGLVSKTRGKYRSRTDIKMAQAIAKQWFDYITNDINDYE